MKPKPAYSTTPQSEEHKANRELVEGIARNISALSDAADALLHGKLKRRAIVILLAHSAGLPQRQVDQVLTALVEMRKEWVNAG